MTLYEIYLFISINVTILILARINFLKTESKLYLFWSLNLVKDHLSKNLNIVPFFPERKFLNKLKRSPERLIRGKTIMFVFILYFITRDFVSSSLLT